MPVHTHYSELNVSHSASTAEIKAAYRAILLANHPDQIQHLAPFARTLADRCIRAAHAAWKELSDPVKAAEYDAELPAWDSFDAGEAWRVPQDSTPFDAPPSERGFRPHPGRSRFSENAGEYEEAGGDEEETSPGAEGSPSSFPSSTPQTPDHSLQAECRYGLTRTAIDIGIKIKGWTLHLLLSTKSASSTPSLNSPPHLPPNPAPAITKPLLSNPISNCTLYVCPP